jgi:formylglycine-generating enzyme required for sulfatase activity/dienelactone hydrolase/predicted Ser/Thr protein kinase
MVGTSLTHYKIENLIGQGGMGVVYRAIDTRLGRAVAVKVIGADAAGDRDRRDRFLKEARAASALNHPNIVTIHEVDHANGIDFLVMELVSGRPLHEVIPPGGLPVERTLDIAEQIAGALATAHAAGIVHRDVKPANIVISDAGQAKMLDFGVAKPLAPSGDAAAATMTLAPATELGIVVGTVAYMSPEQAKGRPIGDRSDIFSFGTVLYEMLAGRRPFIGDSSIDTVAGILTQTPAPIGSIRGDVPRALEALITACLEKAPGRRPNAREVGDQLRAIRERLTAQRLDVRALLQRPAVVSAAAAVAVVAIALAWWWWSASARVRWARTVAIQEIRRLSNREDMDGAYRLAIQARSVLPDDPQLAQLWEDVTFETSISTDPPGADVAVKAYTARDRAWYPLGQSPLKPVRVPNAQLRFRISKAGYEPLEAAVAAAGPPIAFALSPANTAPPDMLRASGGPATVRGQTVILDDYWIDRFEVTNRQFKAFVDGGGYRTRSSWTEPFISGTGTLSWEEAMAALRDTTGRPGPSTWELGTYPEGQADYPVAGVSWYEAAAYAAFAGKSLPTAFHWYHAAGLGNFSDILVASNYSGKGPASVGQYQGLGPFGTYDMAGNVKEWCSTASGARRFIPGGAWNEPSYMFTDLDAQAPFDRQPTYGFRCVKYIKAPPAAAFQPIDQRTRDFTREKPVSDEIFDVFRRMYAYDRRPLKDTVDAVEETDAWRKETVSFDDAVGNERLRAYLFLPKNAAPPFQAVIHFPSGEARMRQSSRKLGLRFVDFIIRSGRAVLFPIYLDTFERRGSTATGPNAERELTIAWSKELGRSIDYLETLRNVDRGRIAFYGFSLGAVVGPILTALEPRLKASIILGGGLVDVPQPPEIEPINFAPRVRVPTLMVSGKQDFARPIETLQRPLFNLLGPPPDQKRLALFEGGHIPRLQDVIREILDWLDRYLGPVTPA